jgi:hypothetical protein
MNHLRSEKLTRFIFSKRHFSVEKKIVKYGAFIPPPDSVDLSIFCISALSEKEVWEIGWRNVETEKRRLKARADIFVSNVYENNLEVVPDPQSHELHANITPFPIDRRERDYIARRLALASKLVLPPEEI